MKIPAQLTVDDFLEAFRVQYRVRRGSLWANLVIIFAGLVLAAGLKFGWQSDAWAYLVLGLLAIQGLPLVYIYILAPLDIHRRLRFDRRELEPYEIEVTPKELLTTRGGSTTRQPWAKFRTYRIGLRVILAVQYDGKYQIIARRWLSEEQFLAIKTYLFDNLGRPKK